MGLGLPNGIPDADAIHRLLECLSPTQTGRALRGWLTKQFVDPEDERQVAAIDGETIPGSKGDKNRGCHVLSEFLAGYSVTREEIVIDEKSNEFSAMPELLKMIGIKGNIAAADTMRCQRDSVAEIVHQSGSYVIELKENEPTLYEDTRLFRGSQFGRQGTDDVAGEWPQVSWLLGPAKLLIDSSRHKEQKG